MMKALLAILLAATPLTAQEKPFDPNTFVPPGVRGEAQPTPTPAPPGPLSFSEVVPAEGVLAPELYNRAKVWFAKAFVSSNNVLQVQDKEAGTLVGKGTFKYEPNVFMGSICIQGFVTFTVTVLVKDGRFKYAVTDFTHGGPHVGCSYRGIDFGPITTFEEPPDTGGLTKGARVKVWKHLKDRSTEEALGLVRTLKDAMAKPVAAGNDW